MNNQPKDAPLTEQELNELGWCGDTAQRPILPDERQEAENIVTRLLPRAVAEIRELRAIVDKLGVASVDGARFDAEAGWRFSMLMVQCLKHPELYPEHVGKCVAAKVARFMREKEAAEAAKEEK